MDYHAKIAYINQHMLTKRDVLESLEKYREHCETTQEEGWSENKRNVILDLLERFSYCLNQMHFPDIQSADWLYQYFWKADGIVLLLERCDELECDKNGEITSMTCSDSIVFAEMKCNYLTVEEYAEKYHVTTTAVRQWIRRGKLRSAVKAGRDWLIPELADRPQRGYEPVTYCWEYLPESVIQEFPFLNERFEIFIIQNDKDKTKFDVILKNRYGKACEKRQLNVKEREKLEIALISEPSVQAKELYQEIVYVPEKESRSYLYGGEIMEEKRYENYQEMLNMLKENYLEISTSNFFYDEDGMLVWGFSAKLLRWNDDENMEPEDSSENEMEDASECDEQEAGDLEKIAWMSNGTVIPAETDFMDAQCAYHSAAELCDSISGDMLSAYLAVADEGQGIKEEILKELDLPEDDSYESSILYIQDMDSRCLQDLKTFLEVFDFVLEGIPAKNCRLAICLMNWERESQKVKIFLECGWKIRSIDQASVLMYRKIG